MYIEVEDSKKICISPVNMQHQNPQIFLCKNFWHEYNWRNCHWRLYNNQL